jgi:uncharacterized protein YjbJ (UPF0337 family)
LPADEETTMSVFGKAKAKAEELLGRAEQLYGESHGDAAATLDGEAHRLEAEAEAEAEQDEHAQPARPRRDIRPHHEHDGSRGAVDDGTPGAR